MRNIYKKMRERANQRANRKRERVMEGIYRKEEAGVYNQLVCMQK